MDEVIAAIVDLPEKEGRGVLVAGNFILTAAHCVHFETSGSMAGGLAFPTFEKVRTAHGGLNSEVWVVEPVSDVAALGEPSPELIDDPVPDDFREFCEKTKPASLCVDDFKLFEGFPVRIYGLGGEWIEGTAKQCGEDAYHLHVVAAKKIERGASGGPIVNESGELVAIVSWFSEGEPFDGSAPRPHMALPAWIVRRILKAQDDAALS